MISIEVYGAERVVAGLQLRVERVRVAVKSSLDIWATELAGYIKTEKLSGQVLNRRSGLLSGSVHPLTEDTERGIIGGAAAGAGVPYARIHEFGGLIPAHEVVARNAKALAFTIDGITRFATRVQIPDVEMPERSYMRSSFDEKSPQGLEGLRAAVKEALVA